MDFGKVEALTEEESLAQVQTDYKITFGLEAYSHKDLTIAFAFEWDFYVVLYILVGVVAVVILVVMMLYHRIVARPSLPGKPIESFKFYSYY